MLLDEQLGACRSAFKASQPPRLPLRGFATVHNRRVNSAVVKSVSTTAGSVPLALKSAAARPISTLSRSEPESRREP